MALTVDQGLAQVMLLIRIEDDAEKRREIRKVLTEVRSGGYETGHRDGWDEGTEKW